MLEEMDAEFGVGELVQQEFKQATKRQSYSDRHLKGLKVDHELDSFGEGKTVILTLKDHDVLDDGEDTLVNVNMIDDERYKKVKFFYFKLKSLFYTFLFFLFFVEY